MSALHKAGKTGTFLLCLIILIVGVTAVHFNSSESSLAGNVINIESTPGDIIACQILDTPGVYVLTADISNAIGTCFNMTSDNITLNGNGHTIDGDDSGTDYGVIANGRLNVSVVNFANITDFYTGVYFIGSNQSSISNLSVYSCTNNGIDIVNSKENVLSSLNSSGSPGFGLYFSASFNNSGSDIVTNGNFYGIDMVTSTNNTFYNMSANSNGLDGIVIESVSINNNFTNVETNFNGNIGFSLSSNNTKLLNLVSTYNSYGLATSTSNNILTNLTVYNNSVYGIYLTGNINYNNVITNVSASTNNYGLYIAHISNTRANNNTFINFNIYNSTRTNIIDKTNSSFTNYLVYNTSYGEIRFTNTSFLKNFTTTSNLTFPGNINIGYNYAYLNSSAFQGQKINSSANITLNNIPTDFGNYSIYKDGSVCTDCYNFTALNAGTVLFNVSSWSNYSIHWQDLTPPLVSIVSPENITYSSSNIDVEIAINESGVCYYSLNNGTTNSSLSANSSQTGFSATETIGTAGAYTLNAYCNDSSGNTNITQSVQFSIVFPSSSSGGGGGGGGGGTVNPNAVSLFSLKIILPEPLVIGKNDNLVVPLTIFNDGQLALSDISLTSTVKKNDLVVSDIRAVLDKNKITALNSGQKENLTLNLIANEQTDGDYVVEIFADVKNPIYQDSAKLYLSTSESGELSNRLVFVEDLIANNPKCAELRENYEEAKRLIENNQISKAEREIENIITSCRELITTDSDQEVGGNNSNLAGYIALGALTVFLLGFLIYFLKHKDSRNELSNR